MNVKIVYANYLNLQKKTRSNKYKYLKLLNKIFSVKLITLDKKLWLGVIWNYILEEASKKSWQTQMFEKRMFWKS